MLVQVKTFVLYHTQNYEERTFVVDLEDGTEDEHVEELLTLCIANHLRREKRETKRFFIDRWGVFKTQAGNGHVPVVEQVQRELK